MPSLKGCCEARESPTARAERTLGFYVAALTDQRFCSGARGSPAPRPAPPRTDRMLGAPAPGPFQEAPPQAEHP